MGESEAANKSMCKMNSFIVDILKSKIVTHTFYAIIYNFNMTRPPKTNNVALLVN